MFSLHVCNKVLSLLDTALELSNGILNQRGLISREFTQAEILLNAIGTQDKGSGEVCGFSEVGPGVEEPISQASQGILVLLSCHIFANWEEIDGDQRQEKC